VLYFFLSYARGNDDPYVERFYEDLCDEVRVLVGERPSTEVGFLDRRSIRPGEMWSSRLIEALNRCETFIALCSPDYFLSEACGREWEIFAQRSRNAREAAGTALLPLMWLPQRRLPPSAQAVHYVNDSFGDIYASSGLRQMLRLQRHRDDYLDFVNRLAERIVQSADIDPLPPSYESSFDSITSAFHPQDLAEPGLSTSQAVQFVVAAGSAAEVSSVRHNLRYYGGRPEDWSPYHPEATRSIAASATDVAAGLRLEARVCDLSRLDDCLAAAHENNQVVVMLLDPWSIRLQPHREILQDFDRRDIPAAAVIVPWNVGDEETQESAPALLETLNDTFPTRTGRRDPMMFRSGVRSLQSFGYELQSVLEAARNRLFATGTVHRRPTSTSLPQRPILEGP
jgi:FxsC-like protein